MTRRLPDAITGPAMAMHSVLILTGYALGAIIAETLRVLPAELKFRVRRAALRRDIDTWSEDVVA